MTFLEIYNASFVSWDPCFKSFDWPEMVRDQAKMNLATHRVRRLSGNYFEPWLGKKILVFPTVVEPMTFWLLVQMVYH